MILFTADWHIKLGQKNVPVAWACSRYEMFFQQIQEVKVIAGENPAHRIMDLVIENRKKNHPMENDAFRCKSYSKFYVDANRDAIDAIPDSTADSTLIEIKKFFNEQYLFMLESSSTRTFIPPSRDKEEVTAYKVSGFSGERTFLPFSVMSITWLFSSIEKNRSSSTSCIFLSLICSDSTSCANFNIPVS